MMRTDWYNAQGVDLAVRAAFTDLATARGIARGVGVYAWQAEHTYEILLTDDLSPKAQEYLAVPAYVLRSPQANVGRGLGSGESEANDLQWTEWGKKTRCLRAL